MNNTDTKQLRIYTIIHTAADADRGNFPAPSVEGSYLSLSQAQDALRRMIENEKENNPIRCHTEDYQEEYSDTHWEAYEDGYAAANFSRYDIAATLLTLD